MSEPKLISPMLDNFAMGDPITDRNGVRCCPAMEKNSESKYIVKIISSPASQTKLDALILSGAYPDVQSATAYFKTIAESIVEEAETLKRLSQLEGFLSYDNWQLVPMGTEAGYDVYILSKYRKTLAHQLNHTAMTHLDAINLGLDLCASLAVCRRLGYLYVDLKPENIYLNHEDAYRIGDIGFIRLDSLKYASLPDRYRSAYTAPEIADAFSSLNTTIDVYALGLILYQVFNGGQLPVASVSADSALPAPDYADYEMAEIILKACAYDPSDRWQDPVEMGQALVSYMQRNGAHNTPIVPSPTPIAETSAGLVESEDSDEAETDSLPVEESNAVEQTDVLNEEPQDSEETLDDTSDSENADQNSEILATDEADETLPGNDAEDIDYNQVSEEVSDILNQADDLLAHPIPDPVIQPEPVDIVLPDTVTEGESDNAESPLEEPDNSNDQSIEQSDATDEQLPQEDDPEIKVADEIVDAVEDYDSTAAPEPTHKKPFSWGACIIVALSVLFVGLIGYLFYTLYYVQPIQAFTVQENTNGNITVLISSDVADEELFVICTDTYGIQLQQTVSDGKARFTGLKPDSLYSLKVGINGFHSLSGETELTVSTPPLTDIVQFLAVTGSEDGSAVLSFTVNGPDSEQWKLNYAAAGEAAQTVTFTGHMYTITGLTLGSEYTFTLTPESTQDFTGINVITHTAAKVVKPTNLQITGCMDNKLTVEWAVPEDTAVDSWTVRCFNDSGFDTTQTVSSTSAVFEEIDNTKDYTVEVTAFGMSIGERTTAAANSITAFDLKFESSEANALVVSWNCSEVPSSGWVLQYSVDGSAVQKIPVEDGNNAIIPAPVPGALYSLVLQTGDGAAVLGGIFEHKTAEAASFSGYGVTADNMTFSMCKTPKSKNWDRFDLKKSDYTNSFDTETKASFLVKMNHKYKVSNDKITTLYVIRDKSGNIVSNNATTAAWKNMWYNNYCELDIPALPTDAGKYTIAVYLNGAIAHQQSFTVTK